MRARDKSLVGRSLYCELRERVKVDRVFLFAHSQYRHLLLQMAQLLRQDHGAEIHLYCSTTQELNFWQKENSDGLFESINVDNNLYGEVEKTTEGRESVIIDRAKEIEEWLGVTINEIAVCDRHLGRGYALGGFNHPRSRYSERTSYLQMVAAFCAQIDFWIREFEQKKPTLVMAHGKVPCLVSRRYGIPLRVLAGSRFKNLHYWAENEFFESSGIEEEYIKAKGESTLEIEAPYRAHMTLRDKFIKDQGIFRLLFQSAKLVLQRSYWRIRNYEKSKGYFVTSELSFLWRRRRDLRYLSSISIPLSDLEGDRFVYYPLHTEPEVALQVLSPEYFYQLSSIAAISRDLPAGVKLAVKETFAAAGRRPADFYRQIKEFKNVVFVHPMELGLNVIKKAEGVVTITGTAGLEAAVMGKPVITFGRHNIYNCLPHVSLVTDGSNIKEKLDDILNKKHKEDTSIRDGKRFLEGLSSISFDMKQYDFINLNDIEKSSATDALKCLVESLER